MNTTDINSDKLRLIEYLVQIQDKVLIQRIKYLVENVLNRNKESQIHPMSLNQFHARIEESEKALEKGDTITQDELREEVKTWRTI
ncbi:MAG: hypothetical protein GY757_24115 [bacterium]|nr:hypothetical protein [bacterium]